MLLAGRCLQAILVVVINFSVLVCLPVSFVAMANNLIPVVTILLSYMIFNEQIKPLDQFFMLISFTGVTIVAVCYPETRQASFPLWAVLACLCVPILSSFGSIMTKKMENLHCLTISSYINPLLTSFVFVYILVSGTLDETMDLAFNLDHKCIFCLSFIGIGTVLMQVFRFKAL